MSKKNKIIINGIPVYKYEMNNGDTEFFLYQDYSLGNNQIVISKGKTFIEQSVILMNIIADLTGSNNNFKYGISIRYDI